MLAKELSNIGSCSKTAAPAPRVGALGVRAHARVQAACRPAGMLRGPPLQGRGLPTWCVLLRLCKSIVIFFRSPHCRGNTSFSLQGF